MSTGRLAQRGFSYLFVLMLVAIVGIGLAAAGTLWHTESQRAREAELLFVGNQYRLAIRSYYEFDQSQPRLPQGIDDLLEDRRGAGVVRHLRRAYSDPLTGAPMALIRMPDTQGIVGVHSRATGRPFKTSGFSCEDESLTGADRYTDWRFEYRPPTAHPPTTSGASKPKPFKQCKI
jgi:type II secretory pathway pseudopilin PulG